MLVDQLPLEIATPISQDEINAILWRACDTFRGTVDPSEYKNYILVMLFVKYISDAWRDHYQQYKQQFGDDEERIRRRMSRERFALPEGCDFDSLYRQRNNTNLGEAINKALEKIEDANRVKLAGVFRNIDFNSEANLGRTGQRNERLKHLLEDFADRRLDLRPSRVGNLDVIGNAYEYLIGRFASGAGKKAGEFYTPPEVSELLARLVDPQPGERICDPACGSGSLLIKCARQVGSENVALYGQENNGATWALAMMNMFLHNINSPRIEWGDTLKRPSLVEDDRLMHFDAAILLFRRQRPDTSVMFIDASREFGEGPNQNKLRPRDIQRIVETYRQRQNVDKYAYLASYDEIKANDFNLNIPRYVDTFIGETEVDVATVQVQIDALEQELNSVQQQLGGFLQELGYGE